VRGDACFEVGHAGLSRLAGLVALPLFGEDGTSIVSRLRLRPGPGNRRDPRGARAARPHGWWGLGGPFVAGRL